MRICLLSLLCLLSVAASTARGEGEPLKLLISVESAEIAAPYPARLTLQIHNAGKETLWLYRRALAQARGGATLDARLEPVGTELPPDNSSPARARVFDNVGLPHPKLIRLNPDDDTAEKTVLEIIPAHQGPEGKGPPVWGRYRLTVTYRARYSNAEEIRRNLGVILWQGETTSNSIEIDLQPPPGQGSVSGTVQLKDGRLLPDVLVSVSDGEERLVGQVTTDGEGRYSLGQLPFGTYWVTLRRPDRDEDTVVFQHVDVTASAPAATADFLLIPPEIYDAVKILHKPVLFRVTDKAGQPLEKVSLEITWSNGTVLDSVKAETLPDGIAAVELIPGRNFVTLKRRGCPKQEERADVATGGGVDGFKYILDCEKR